MQSPHRATVLILVLASLLTPWLASAKQPTDPAGIMSQAGACAALNYEVHATPECDAEMAADPVPPVVGLAVDYGAVASYTYWRVTGDTPLTVYRTPNGSPLYRLEPGFNFVTPRQTQGGWTEINAGEWVQQDRLAPVEPSRFAGVLIQAEPSRPFGWTLESLYLSSRPGGPPIYAPEMHVNRYHLVYVYAAVNVDGLNWYLIGPGRWIEQRFIGLVQRVPRPDTVRGRWVAIDLYEQTLAAYEDDALIFATLVASGIPGFSTNTGLFRVWGRRLNGLMSGAEGQPDYYRLENVPYALYFDGDISLHGTYWHDGFGYRRSHGCVNLSITDAHWLYDWLGVEGWVYIYYSQLY